MYKYNSAGRPPDIPAPDDSENKIWQYALSFKGYTWVVDKFNNCKFEELISRENADFLDTHIYPNDNWRNGEGEPCGPALLSCIGGDKNIEDVSIEELRAILFWEQRGNRWHDDWPNSSLEFARDIIEAIIEKYNEKTT